MSELTVAAHRRTRVKYSRLICLGCRERRIRCELPSGVEIPGPGELRTIQTPCYRCERLGIACVVRQTILGRPGHEKRAAAEAYIGEAKTEDIVLAAALPSGTMARPQPTQSQDEMQPFDGSVTLRVDFDSSSDNLPGQRDLVRCKGGGLLNHRPTSTETIFVTRAIDTLRYEYVEEEWFRHLPAHFGHTRALDLSIYAIVTACAHARGLPTSTSSDIYQTLALAIDAVHADIKQSHGTPNDQILASTALLAPFQGVVQKNGIPTRLHVDGLAAILAARPSTYPVTQFAREIFDFHACESAIMDCIQGTPSPFENVARSYFASDRMGRNDSDRARLKALANELFIRIPRLVGLVRSLRFQICPPNHLLLDALGLLNTLLTIQDPQLEWSLLRNIKVAPPSASPDTSGQSLRFVSIEDFEALSCYWQSRLSLLRLELRLRGLPGSNVQADWTEDSGFSFQPRLGLQTNEMLRLARNILMCSEYARSLRLNKHTRIYAHAIVGVWGVVTDVPEALNYNEGEQKTGSLSDLLLRSVNHALGAKPDLTAEDMNTAADVFVGGLPKGRFAQLYSC